MKNDREADVADFLRHRATHASPLRGWPIQSVLTSDPNHHGKPLTADEAKKALALLDA